MCPEETDFAMRILGQAKRGFAPDWIDKTMALRAALEVVEPTLNASHPYSRSDQKA